MKEKQNLNASGQWLHARSRVILSLKLSRLRYGSNVRRHRRLRSSPEPLSNRAHGEIDPTPPRAGRRGFEGFEGVEEGPTANCRDRPATE